MLTTFLDKMLKRAKYKLLADGTFFGEISGCRGVWSNAKTLEVCRTELRSALEDWLLLKIRGGEQISGLKIDSRLATCHA